MILKSNRPFNQILTFSTLLLLLCNVSNARTKFSRYDCGKNVAKAMKKYEDERYNRTKTILTEAKLHCAGHSSMDTILFFLGMANLKTKSYDDAQINFEQVYQEFPQSPLSERAFFRTGYCKYFQSPVPQRDQTKTNDAIKSLQRYIQRYPGGTFADSAKYYIDRGFEKLAEKNLQIAKFYESIDKYESSIIYYQTLITDFPESEFVPVSMLSCAKALIKVNRVNEARSMLTRLLSMNPEKTIASKAELAMSKIKKMTGASEEASPLKNQKED